MREILFRGKRIDNGEWIYGYLIGKDIILNDIFIDANDKFGVNSYYVVNPKTVGQYTGLKDKNGVKIFEGDILKVLYNRIGDVFVEFKNGKYNVSAYNLKECAVVKTIHDKEVQ